MVVVDGLNYLKSTREGKKLMVKVNGKTIHFGDRNMQHYYDRTRLFSNLDHVDKVRRSNYLKRASKIRDGNNRLTVNNIDSANYHAIRILW
jgi:hypothetical protein